MPGTTDTVKAKLTPGEFVIRKEAVDMIGVPMLNKLNNMPKEGGHSAIDNIIDMATMANMKMMYGGGMVKPNYAGGGMVQQYGHGGSVDKMMGYAEGGQLKSVPQDNPGLGKLPEMVRNRMGYMQMGGMVDNSLMGMAGYKRGGYVSEKERRSPMGMKFKRYENGGLTGNAQADSLNAELERSIMERSKNPTGAGLGMISPEFRPNPTMMLKQQEQMLQSQIEDSIQTKAMKTLQLLKLKGLLNQGERIENPSPMFDSRDNMMRIRDSLRLDDIRRNTI